MKNPNGINISDINSFKKDYLKDSKAKIVRNALNKNSIESIVVDSEALKRSKHQFSIDIPTMKATSQNASGRCWLFAGVNVFREKIAKDLNLESFELSQNYLAFWDKFEKINYFLESVIDLIDKEPDDRTLSWVLKTGIQDGGQWDMVVSLVEKYGVIPKSAMEETFQSSNTRGMNQLINAKLRGYAYQLQTDYKNGDSLNTLQEKKQIMLKELYNFLCSCFGVPPTSFDFEYVDKNKNYHLIQNLTPLQFKNEYLNENLDDYISIIHAPTKDKPYNETFTVKYLGNVIGGKQIKYLNLEINQFKSLVLSQLKNNEIVWFGSDCGKYGDRETGVWDDKMYDYQTAFDMSFDLDKAVMLDYGHGAMNHAMVITGVNLIDDKPTKWKIENSWSEKPGNKGYFVMSDSWFDNYVYQAVVHKKYLSEDLLKDWDKKPIELNPWDPMGSLAE